MKTETKISNIVNKCFNKVNREGVGFLDTNMKECILQMNKLLEEELLKQFISIKFKTESLIVDFYKGYIIFANNDIDLRYKRQSIGKGDCRGFYEIEYIKKLMPTRLEK